MLIKLGIIAHLRSGGTPSRNRLEYWNGNIPWLKSGELNDNTYIEEYTETINQLGLSNSSAKVINKGTVVIAMYGATLGKLGILGIDTTTNQAVCAIENIYSAFINKYIYYYLFSIRNSIIKDGFGGAQPNISKQYLENIPIPLVSLPHQTLIVDEIEKQLSRLESGLSSLQKLQTLVKQYRASVLSSAVSGKLVPQDPSDEPASLLLERILEVKKEKRLSENPGKKYKESLPIDTSELGELPDGWCWCSVEQITVKHEYGSSAKANEKGDIPVLRMGNIQNGKLDFSDLKYYPKNHPDAIKLELQDRDFLFNRTNSAELVGKTAIYYKDKHENPCTFAGYLIRVQINHELFVIEYLHYYLNSVYGRSYINSVVTQQVGQANVNGTKLANMIFPLPPLAEQQHIVEEVERRFSVLDKLEQTITENITRAQQLKQSILHQAFSGQLVDYDDDPTEIEKLLTQIDQSKEEMQKTGKRKNN